MKINTMPDYKWVFIISDLSDGLRVLKSHRNIALIELEIYSCFTKQTGIPQGREAGPHCLSLELISVYTTFPLGL